MTIEEVTFRGQHALCGEHGVLVQHATRVAEVIEAMLAMVRTHSAIADACGFTHIQ